MSSHWQWQSATHALRQLSSHCGAVVLQVLGYAHTASECAAYTPICHTSTVTVSSENVQHRISASEGRNIDGVSGWGQIIGEVPTVTVSPEYPHTSITVTEVRPAEGISDKRYIHWWTLASIFSFILSPTRATGTHAYHKVLVPLSHVQLGHTWTFTILAYIDHKH